ncbi:putative cytochrome P450 [Xylariomycetidae sp. FL2044]|nr:putative cytochrome P450 [Xylariomycetidae sp. FL2044]
MSVNYITIVLSIGALLVGRLIFLSLRRSALSLPPGPKPLPLIGNLHQLPKSLPWLELYHMSKQHGPIMHLNMAGQPLIVLSSNRAAQDLLSRRGGRYSERPRMVMSGELVTKGMHMLLRPYDAAYKLHQRMEAPLLMIQAARCYQPIQDLESRQLLWDVLHEHDVSGEKGIDFNHHFERAMASFIYCVQYGFRLKTGFEQELQDAHHVMAEFSRTGQVGAYLVDTLPWLNYLPKPLAPWKKEGEMLYELERALHVGNFEKGLANPGWNFSKHMKNSPEGRDMSVEELAFDVGILADAALDTSTVILSWFIVAWITCGTRWVPQARAQLEKVVGKDRLPTYEDRPRLAYIDAIVHEVMRWRPAAPGGVPHFIKTEDTYAGYRIPANSVVIGNHYAIARDESTFGEAPDEFRPERWLVDEGSYDGPVVDACGLDTKSLKDLPSVGFGFGRRICTGRHIARSQLFLQVARVLWAFDVEAGVVNESTGKKFEIDDMDCCEGFITYPKSFKAVMRPRGQWVRDVILKAGTTHNVDHAKILDQCGQERLKKSNGSARA